MLPLFNNAIYASAAINNYNNVAAAAQVLYDDRERAAAAASQKKRRCGARLARCSRAAGYTCQSLSGGDIIRPVAGLITLQIY